MSRWIVVVLAALAAAIAGLVAADRSAAAEPLCAFREGTSRDGLIATATFHVVRDDCQVSFVSISKFATGSAIHDTATGTFDESDTRYTLSVHLPCGVGAETDLVLGPPTLYPPADLDLGVTPFNIPCPSGGGGSTGGGGGGAGGGGGGGGGGTTGPLPDLVTTLTASKTAGLRIGDRVTVTLTVTNKGKAAASGVHLLVSLPETVIPNGRAVASRGPGCKGVTVVDCDLGSLGVGAVATVRMPVSVARGRTLFVAGTAQQAQDDELLKDNIGTLTVKVLPRLVAFTIAAVPSRFVSGEQLLFIKLSKGARVSAQLYLRGKAQPIRWRRTLKAGTQIVRVPVPGVRLGQRFTLVVRATSGTRKVSATLRLRAKK
jgi:uncharacterized repeat protein (TIGR01451 family)